MAQSCRRCYCSVPYCSNNKQKFPYLSFHDFPVDEKIRARWVKAIRRAEGPTFRILRGSTFVCSQHFPPEDTYVSACRGRIRIKQGAVPSRFPWNNWGTGKGSQARESVSQQAGKCDSQAMLVQGNSTKEALPACAVAHDHDYACHPSLGKPYCATQKMQKMALQVMSPKIEIQQPTVTSQQPLVLKFCVTDEDYRYYTRFSSKEVFNVFWKTVCPSASQLVCWWAQQTAQVTPSPERKLPPIDELFMFLCRVAAGLQEKTLSSIFEVSLATVSRIISTWTSYLYQVLGSLPVWMTRQQVHATMPDKFKLYCPQVRVIMDCAKIHCETPSSLSLQSEASSKNHTTFKGLIGVAPCGVITFVSKLYTGSISKTAITQKSNILHLLQPGDGVMADKGFLIERMLSELGATLIVPPLKTSPQLSSENALKTKAIARLRIVVERAIQRVKEYRIWDGPVPLSTVGLVNQLWAICCLMSNYQGPLDIKVDKPV